jgi:hypothetical protein
MVKFTPIEYDPAGSVVQPRSVRKETDFAVPDEAEVVGITVAPVVERPVHVVPPSNEN